MSKMIFALAGLFMSIVSLAQGNFSGTWTLKEKTHIAGPEYSNAVPKQIKLDSQKDSIIIESVNTGADGQDVTSRQSFAINGKPAFIVSASSKRKYTKTFAWSADKKSLVLTIVFSLPENENEVDFTRVETWTLSADGKQLNIDKKSVETRSETWEVKAVFDKQ